MKVFNQSFINSLRTSSILRTLRNILSNCHNIFEPKLSPLSVYIEANKIDLILDIGANIGQFAVDIRSAGYKGSIWSFEPDPTSFKQLAKRAERDSNWKCFNLAFGLIEGTAQLNVSANSGLSSSFLKMANLHEHHFPKSKFVGIQDVPMGTLDNFLSGFKVNLNKTLVKMDVQGFESEVIEGGKDSFERLKACYFESSLGYLYEGEKLFLELLISLKNFGLHPFQIFPGILGVDGLMLQVDTLVVRSEAN